MKVKPSNIPIAAVEKVICYVLGCPDAISWLRKQMEKPPTSQQAPQIHGLEETVVDQLDMIARHTKYLRVKANEVSGYPVLTTFLEDFVRIAPQSFQIELNFTQLKFTVYGRKEASKQAYTRTCAMQSH